MGLKLWIVQRIYELIAFASQKFCSFWKPISPRLLHPKCQKIQLLLSFTSSSACGQFVSSMRPSMCSHMSVKKNLTMVSAMICLYEARSQFEIFPVKPSVLNNKSNFINKFKNWIYGVTCTEWCFLYTWHQTTKIWTFSAKDDAVLPSKTTPVLGNL